MKCKTILFSLLLTIVHTEGNNFFRNARSSILSNYIFDSDGSEIPIITLKSYSTKYPLEEKRRFGTTRKLLRPDDEQEPTHNVTKYELDIYLGRGGEEEWTVPIANGTLHVSQVVVECQSNDFGPVEWEYSGFGDFVNIEVKNGRSANATSFRKDTFISTIYIRNLTDKMTGQYSCRSVENPKNFNTFHLFVPFAGRPYLLERGRTINMTAEPNNNIVTLPCMVNTPKAKVLLFKKHTFHRLGLTILKYQHQPFHLFDPRTGFLIDTSERVEKLDPFGTYICTSHPDIREGSDRVKINLSPPPGFNRKSDSTTATLPSFYGYGLEPMRNTWKRFIEVVNAMFA